MPLSRLLAIALLALPFTAFGQNKPNDTPLIIQHNAGATTASEPSWILPMDVAQLAWPKDASAQIQARTAETAGKGQEQGIILEDVPNSLPNNKEFVSLGNRLFSSGELLIPEVTCLKIRSYVVARDSKNSESTHLVHYSTCQPASRYRVKTIQLQPPPSR